MIELIYQQLNITNVGLMSLMVLCNSAIIYFWHKPALQNFHNIYSAEQKIHDIPVPRFAGISLIFVLTIAAVLEIIPLFETVSLILICCIPVILVTFLEDLYNNIQPKARFLCIIFSASFLIICGDFNLPIIQLPWLLNDFVNNPFIMSIILIFSITALANGFNLIDGANGLFSFNILSILTALFMLSTSLGDKEFLSLWSFLFLLYLANLFLNFPLGKIFLGDLGAYVSGIVLGFLIIIFFGRHPELMTWHLILLLFYPIFEILFSMIRRFLAGATITKADRAHLHQLIFDTLKKKSINSLWANNLCSVIITPIWIFPALWTFIYIDRINFEIVVLGIMCQIFIYLSYYFIFKKYSKIS